jgi:MFS family permease
MTSQAALPTEGRGFFRVFGGVGALSFLTYVGEYASFTIVLAFLSDQLTVNFRLGGVGYAYVGLISSGFLITSGLIAIGMGHLCDKYGRRRLMIAGCVLGAVSLYSLLIANNLSARGELVPFGVAVAVSLSGLGIAHGTYTASTLAYGGDLAEKHQTMGKAYGLVDGAEFAGYAFGPAVGTTISVLLNSRTDVFIISAVLLLASAGLAVFLMPEIRPPSGRGELDHDHTVTEPDIHAHSHSATWRDYANAFRMPIVGVALLTTLVGAIGFSAFFYDVPLYALSLDKTVPLFKSIFGYFASVMAISGVLFMVPFGHFEDRTKRRMPYLVVGLICASASLSFVFFAASLEAFLVASVTFGLAIGVVRVSQLVILAEASHPSNRAAIMGTNHAVEHVGYGLATAFVGVFVALMGFSNAFRVLSGVLVVAGVLFLIYGRWAKVK